MYRNSLILGTLAILVSTSFLTGCAFVFSPGCDRCESDEEIKIRVTANKAVHLKVVKLEETNDKGSTPSKEQGKASSSKSSARS